MVQFVTKLEYDYIGETRIELTSPLLYVDGDTIYCVPIGFKSDGASVPKLFRWFHSPFDKGLEGAVLHDYLLDAVKHDLMPFTECNRVFKKALKITGVGWFKRTVLTFATDLNAIFVHNNDNPDTWEENQKDG